MWKVGGIKIERTRAWNFFYRRTRKSVKNFLVNHSVAKIFQRENFWGQGPSEPPRTQVSEYLYERGVLFWPCFGRPKSHKWRTCIKRKKTAKIFLAIFVKRPKNIWENKSEPKKKITKKIVSSWSYKSAFGLNSCSSERKKDFSAHTSEKILTSLDK